jgi:hypothetical protein
MLGIIRWGSTALTWVHETCRNHPLCTYGAGVEPSPLLMRPLIGLLYQYCMIGGDDCGVAGETEVLGGNLPQCGSVHHKSHMTLTRTRRLTA